MALTRRVFMRNGAMAVVAGAMVPQLLTRAVLAQTTDLRRGGKRLVVIFQRGAVDGLNMVVPFREPAYYSLRSSIAVPERQLIDLDGFFGLHPAMAALKPMWDARELAAVHACGSPDPTRSHFDAQTFMESGTPGVSSTTDGWLNRALSAGSGPRSAFRAIAMDTAIPRTLAGAYPTIAMGSIAGFGISNAAQPSSVQAEADFAALYSASGNTILHGTASETFEAIRMLRAADPEKYQPANGAAYPRSPFGSDLRSMAQLMKANLGVEVAFAEMGGWDTHERQGGAEGQLANRLRDWSESLAAFRQDMGHQGDDILIVTMSEFGRTVHENGTGGTDHGHANVMLVMGAPVAGGRVYGQWPGLGPDQLNENRDLKVTTDFRQVLATVVAASIDPANQSGIFPHMPPDVNQLRQILKA